MRKPAAKTVFPVIVAGALGLSACGGGGGGGGGGATETVDLRLAHVFPEPSTVHEAAKAFADDVAERTDGAVDVTVFSGGALGGDAEMGAALTRNELDCAMTNHPAAGMDPRLQLGFLPYIVSSYEGADEIFYGDGIVATNDRQVPSEPVRRSRRRTDGPRP